MVEHFDPFTQNGSLGRKRNKQGTDPLRIPGPFFLGVTNCWNSTEPCLHPQAAAEKSAPHTVGTWRFGDRQWFLSVPRRRRLSARKGEEGVWILGDKGSPREPPRLHPNAQGILPLGNWRPERVWLQKLEGQRGARRASRVLGLRASQQCPLPAAPPRPAPNGTPRGRGPGEGGAGPPPSSWGSASSPAQRARPWQGRKRPWKVVLGERRGVPGLQAEPGAKFRARTRCPLISKAIASPLVDYHPSKLGFPSHLSIAEENCSKSAIYLFYSFTKARLFNCIKKISNLLVSTFKEEARIHLI